MMRGAMTASRTTILAVSAGRLRLPPLFSLLAQSGRPPSLGSSRVWPGGGCALLTGGSSASFVSSQFDFESAPPVKHSVNSSPRKIEATPAKIGSVTGSGVMYGGVRRSRQSGRLQEDVEAAERAVQQGLPSRCNSTVYLALLQQCENDLAAGRRVHALIDKVGLASNATVGTQLLQLYTNAGSLQEALQVFQNLPTKNVFAWTTIISACAKHGQGEQSVKLYEQMRLSAIKPDKYLFVAVLKGCASTGALTKGKLIHSHIVKEGYDSNVFVCNSLIGMYCKSGSLQDARKVFDEMLEPDVVSWNTMIRGYLQQGFSQDALDLFERMQGKGMKPDEFTFVSILKACSTTGSLVQAKKIHRYAVESGLHTHVFVGSALMDMYFKFGKLEEAQAVFDSLPRKDGVSWNGLIAGYAQHGFGQEALFFFSLMQQQGNEPDRVSYLSALKACSGIGALDQGRLMHRGIVKAGLELDVFVGSTVVDMFVNCGELKEARAVFDRISVKDVVTWTTMIAGYAQQGHGHDALQLYARMQQEGLQPNEFTLVSILKACSMIGALEQGKVIHANSIAGGFDSNRIFCSTLIDMYARCGSVADARMAFDGLKARDLLSWNAMIAGYAQHGSGSDAIQLFQQMQGEGVQPDKVTFISILKACAMGAAFEQGKLVHFYVDNWGLKSDIHLGNALIDMYVGCGHLAEASSVFDMLPARDLMSWTAMIAGLAQHGDGKESLHFYRRMQQEGVRPTKITFLSVLKVCSAVADLAQGRLIHNHIDDCGFGSDVYVGSCLIYMYCKCGSLEDAREVFDRLPSNNLVSWTALITGYVQRGDAQEALHLFRKMQMDGLHPDDVSLATILKACSSAASLHIGQLIHSQVKQRGREADVVIRSALIDMYGKCGSPEHARKVFDESATRDLVTWNAMIAVHAHHGDFEEALHLLEVMQSEDVHPNNVTFVCLLSACSHAGLVDVGTQLFKSMSDNFNISPDKEHYACMVNLLGRAGRLAEAEDLIMSMPAEPDIVAWMSLLGACKLHNNTEVGRKAFQAITKLDPKSSGAYVLMSSIYTATGRSAESNEVKKMMETAGARKVPGRTWMELDNEVHTFQVADVLHPERKNIFQVMSSMESALGLN